MSFYTNFSRIGENVVVRGFKNGQRFTKRIKYQPYLFIPTNDQSGEYKTIDGIPVKRMDFASMYEAKDFTNRYQGVTNFDIYGLTNYEYVLINDLYQQLEFDPELIRVAPVDIEVASDDGFPDIAKAEKPVTAISISVGDQIDVFGCGDYTPHQPNITYHKCENEKRLLAAFVVRFIQLDIDVLTGWNIEMFDIPYLINRMCYLFGQEDGMKLAKAMSPWKKINTRTFETVHGEQSTYDIVGIATLDYLPLFKKFSFKEHESYKLDHIAHTELGKRKVDYSDYESLLDLYQKNFQLFIEYNVRDITLIPELEAKLQFIRQVFELAYDARVNYVDALTTVRMWDVIIHNYLMASKIVVPAMKGNNPQDSIPGGFVKDPVAARYKWVVSFDLTSLYPMLIQHYNISPDMFRGKVDYIGPDGAVEGGYVQHHDMLKSKNVCITPNGCLFSRDREGFLAALMNKLFMQRDQYKKEMLKTKQEKERYQESESEPNLQRIKQFDTKISQLHSLQYSKKIQLNSVYGALANRYFRWYSLSQAEAITSSGQLTIKWIAKATNKWFNKIFDTDKDYVIACDTDSMYLLMEPFVEQMVKQKIVGADDTAKIVQLLDKICQQKVEPFLAKQFKQLGEYANSFQQKLHMKRECISDAAIWVAKKRYIMNVYNEEGVQYADPKLKVVGVEAVRSSTPAVCRENIKKAMKLILNKSNADLIEFIDDFRNQFEKMPFEDVAFPRGVHKVSQYKSQTGIYRKGTPIHVRGALVYNHLLEKLGLQNVYQPIFEGDKIKFCYMRLPNPAHENVISVPDMLPKQFEMGTMIDYQTQFDKAFLSPLRNITDVIGWELEQIAQVQYQIEQQPTDEEFIE